MLVFIRPKMVVVILVSVRCILLNSFETEVKGGQKNHLYTAGSFLWVDKGQVALPSGPTGCIF